MRESIKEEGRVPDGVFVDAEVTEDVGKTRGGQSNPSVNIERQENGRILHFG